MEEKLLEGYKKLSLLEKRKELNTEMIRLFEIIDNLCKSQNYSPIKEKISRFNDLENNNLTEEEYLNKIYSYLIYLRKNIINYFSWKE